MENKDYNNGNFDYSKFLDSNGQLDMNKLQEYVTYMLKAMANRDVDSKDVSTNDLFGNMSKKAFVQDLNDENNMEKFNSLVSTYNLKREYEVIDDKEGILIKEDWTNEEQTINVNRIYTIEGAIENNILDSNEIKEIYNIIMEKSVEKEEYEKAAIYRDKIKEISE